VTKTVETKTAKPAAAKTSPYDVLEATFVGALGPGSDPTSLEIASLEVAFAGRSNVGKSSLINTLVQRRGLVRTSGTPGCTRQINFFSVRARDQTSLVLVDLPGYGFAKRSKTERQEWADLIEGYLAKRANLRAVVVLVDARRGMEEDDLELVRFLVEGRKSNMPSVVPIVVATKADKLPKSRANSLLAALSSKGAGAQVRAIPFSSETRAGWAELWKAIRAAVGLAPSAPAPSGPAPAG
jgi:GTP-binding protein